MRRADPILALAAAGLGCVSLGAGLIFVPAALIVLGVGLLVYAVFLAPDTHKGGPQP